MTGLKWKFVSIAEKTELQFFDCGILELNDYLKRYAGQNHRKGLGSTYVLVPAEGEPIVAGYHTLSMAQVELHTLPESHRKNLPKYPVPAVRLARLAVDRKWQGTGLGEILLMDAIRRSVVAVQSVAAKYMIVDAKNKKAEEFYARYRFHSFEGGSHSLVAAMDTLKGLFTK
jgi:ribosomal protein S18 acetylase RimI-like enzyme